MPTESSAPSRAFSGVRTVVVAHGPPMRGGISTVALDIVEDAELNEEFEIVFYNTSQNDNQRGKLGLKNIVRAFGHTWGTFRRARPGGVVHTHSVQDPVFVAWRQVAIAIGGRLRGSRVILHNHAGKPQMLPPGDYRVGRAHQLAFRFLDRLADANVLIAATGESNLRQYMPTVDLPVVNNSVVVDDLVPSTADHETPVLLFVGELLERKGLVVLLDALDLLEQRGCDDFEFRLVGDNRPGLDVDKDEMIDLVDRRGRADAMTGPLPRNDVYDHWSEADIFVMPTYTEGQPFTVIESLAAGVPIVASDIPAINDMICDGDNGDQVTVGDPVALADAIEALLNDAERRSRVSTNNRALARKRFDRPVFRNRIADLYRLHGRPSRSVRRRQRAIT
jgi:glycosyltransferase involved in cell wall biosynthesis